MVSSGFGRQPLDRYFTEPWVTRALVHGLEREGLVPKAAWEPACGRGDVTRVLADHCEVWSSDVDASLCRSAFQADFLKSCVPMAMIASGHDQSDLAIVTNPPYGLAEEFVRHALGLRVGLVCMLLRAEWVHAASRVDLFEQSHLGLSYRL